MVLRERDNEVERKIKKQNKVLERREGKWKREIEWEIKRISIVKNLKDVPSFSHSYSYLFIHNQFFDTVAILLET